MWQKLVREKYKIDRGIYKIHGTMNDSPCWADLIKNNDLYLKGRIMKVGNGLFGVINDEVISLYSLFFLAYFNCAMNGRRQLKMNDTSRTMTLRRWLNEQGCYRI